MEKNTENEMETGKMQRLKAWNLNCYTGETPLLTIHIYIYPFWYLNYLTSTKFKEVM